MTMTDPNNEERARTISLFTIGSASGAFGISIWLVKADRFI